MFIVAYSPQGNGLVERVNGVIIEALSHLVSETQEDWCEQLPFALLSFRTAFHNTILENPAYLVYGRDLILPEDIWNAQQFSTYADTRTYAQEITIRLQRAFRIVKDSLEKAADKQILSDTKCRDKQIKVGDVVYLHQTAIKRNLTKKLSRLNKGPYRVTEQFSPVLYEITFMGAPAKKQKVHANRLIKVPYRERSMGQTQEQSPGADNIQETYSDGNGNVTQNSLNRGNIRSNKDTIDLMHPVWESGLGDNKIEDTIDPEDDWDINGTISPVSFLNLASSDSSPSSTNSSTPNSDSDVEPRYFLRERDNYGRVVNK